VALGGRVAACQKAANRFFMRLTMSNSTIAAAMLSKKGGAGATLPLRTAVAAAISQAIARAHQLQQKAPQSAEDIAERGETGGNVMHAAASPYLLEGLNITQVASLSEAGAAEGMTGTAAAALALTGSLGGRVTIEVSGFMFAGSGLDPGGLNAYLLKAITAGQDIVVNTTASSPHRLASSSDRVQQQQQVMRVEAVDADTSCSETGMRFDACGPRQLFYGAQLVAVIMLSVFALVVCFGGLCHVFVTRRKRQQEDQDYTMMAQEVSSMTDDAFSMEMMSDD
jgi:hypothetical protein